MPDAINVMGARRPMAIGDDGVAEGDLEVRVSASWSISSENGCEVKWSPVQHSDRDGVLTSTPGVPNGIRAKQGQSRVELCELVAGGRPKEPEPEPTRDCLEYTYLWIAKR
jgi:hypothetical protein